MNLKSKIYTKKFSQPLYNRNCRKTIERMQLYTLYIYLILFLKFMFMVASLSLLHLKVTKQDKTAFAEKIKYWRGRIEFSFVILMALLLIYVFRPNAHHLDKAKQKETQYLLYVFGFILLITAKWEQFIKEGPWLKAIQTVLGKDE